MAHLKAYLTVFMLMWAATNIVAQNGASYQVANRLMQQQRFEEALPILHNVSLDQPNVFLFLDRLVECHIQLKQYDEAISTVQQRIDSNLNTTLSNVLLGTLFHFKGDTTRAYEIWDTNLAANPLQHQLYINTANKMVDRREFKRAITVYRKAQQVFDNEQLFISDIPQVYMQAGEYQKAIAEWLKLIELNPVQSTAFKRLLIRYNDPLLYEDSVAEVEFKLAKLNLNHKAYDTFYQLQIWLLFENELYRRAFAAASEYERSTTNFNYSLYNVGQNLIENNEFDLALKAFDFYKKAPLAEIRWSSMEQQANVYMRWAKYLGDNNLDFSNQSDSLYQQASEKLDTLIKEGANYSRIHAAYLLKAEIALDHIFDLPTAKKATNYLKQLTNLGDSPEANYLDGRIFLAEKAFTQARISFTRANKQAKVGELAEKTRYFLALTDFYAGDFEFAKIQLKSLGRQNTSYYANNALELRLWLQEGIHADSTGKALQQFANAHFANNTGNKTTARDTLLVIVENENSSPFTDDAYLLLSRFQQSHSLEYYTQLSVFISNSQALAQKEQFLWLKAKLADQLSLNSDGCELDVVDGVMEPNTCISTQEITDNYETLILKYPQGFYAPYARKRLNQLPKPENS